MKVVALVSGGKDSCYNMVKCVQYGHEIVCIANLTPVDSTKQELNSYCFQTVGHNMIPAIAECMGLPLIRLEFDGKSHQRTVEYNSDLINQEAEDKDEVEVLFELLQLVKKKFPQVEAVSCGAIFSDYQRNRVENVCSRLGLISLSYLWRRDQSELLEEMIKNGLEAIMIKTSTMGLNPQRHCGKTLAQLYPLLEKLKVEAWMNVCGEGGEYETLTLDCPLFKKKIVIDESRIVVESDDMYAPVGHLFIEKYHLEEKGNISFFEDQKVIPLDQNIYIKGKEKKIEEEKVKKVMKKVKVSITQPTDNYLHLFAYFEEPTDENSFTEMIALLQVIKDEISKKGFSMKHFLHNILTVKDMKDFSEINLGYSTFFNFNPPSRVCIENDDIFGNVQMECILSLEKIKVLHVQSISEWAPASIGPYSQATVANEVVRLAGQIGLVPQTMNIISDSLDDQIWQCLKNIHRTLEAVDSCIQNTIKCVVYYDAKNVNDEKLLEEKITQKWKDFLDEIGESTNQAELNQLEKIIHLLPVSRLPRNALVEYHVTAITKFVEYMKYTKMEKYNILELENYLFINFEFSENFLEIFKEIFENYKNISSIKVISNYKKGKELLKCFDDYNISKILLPIKHDSKICFELECPIK